MSVQTMIYTRQHQLPEYVTDAMDLSPTDSDETTTFTFSSSPSSLGRPPTPGRGPLSSHPVYSITPPSSIGIGKSPNYGGSEKADSATAGSPSLYEDSLVFGKPETYMLQHDKNACMPLANSWNIHQSPRMLSRTSTRSLKGNSDKYGYDNESLSMDNRSSHDDSRPTTPSRPQSRPSPQSNKGLRKFLSIASLRPNITAMPPLPITIQHTVPSVKENRPVLDFKLPLVSCTDITGISSPLDTPESAYSSPQKNSRKQRPVIPKLEPTSTSPNRTWLTLSPSPSSSEPGLLTPTSPGDFPRSPQSFSSRMSRGKTLSWFKPRFSTILTGSPETSPISTIRGAGYADGGEGSSPKLSVIAPSLPEIRSLGTGNANGNTSSFLDTTDTWGDDIFADIGR